MASSIFRVSRTETEGQQSGPATLNKAQEPVKMRVYEDESEVDLSEIGDKEIFAVAEENDLANVYVTDLVQEGNMNPITSNAVARFTGAGGIQVGAVMAFAKGTQSPNWLECDGRDTTGTAEELRTHYPALYTYLGNSNVLPDYRECTLVGVGQNDTDTIAEHDVYTLGEFKDDQIQTHKHSYYTASAWDRRSAGTGNSILEYQTQWNTGNNTGRSGTTTHGKQKGVAFYIKATSAGIEVDKDLYATKGYVNDAVSYSTTEQLTGGKWIDGKPIYRRVFTGLSWSGQSSSFLPTGITIDGVDQLINVIGLRNTTTNKGPVYLTSARMNDSSLDAYTSSGGFSPGVTTFIVEYTKTTD